MKKILLALALLAAPAVAHAEPSPLLVQTLIKPAVVCRVEYHTGAIVICYDAAGHPSVIA